jgi:hypothetical protein
VKTATGELVEERTCGPRIVREPVHEQHALGTVADF